MTAVNFEYNLPVMLADDGNVPVPGAFFIPNSNWSLSKIASKAYNDSSAWKIINRNQWNIDNLIYRADSTKCTSERRDSVLALSTLSPTTSAKSAYISLCQRDAKVVQLIPPKTVKFPMIWIPDLDRMPMPVKPGYVEPETTPVGPTEYVDDRQIKIDVDIPDKPTAPTTPKTPSKPSSSTTPTKTTVDGSKEKMAGIGLVLGGLAVIAALFIIPSKKGGHLRGLDLGRVSSTKAAKLKKKYMSGAHFKGPSGTGERFKNCVSYFRARGDVSDPKALCASIARKKGY